jgi:hypothetical protein
MSVDEITFQDLLAGEPAAAAPSTFKQLLADGFPPQGGLAELAAIAQMEDPGEQFASVRQGYQQILKIQRRMT